MVRSESGEKINLKIDWSHTKNDGEPNTEVTPQWTDGRNLSDRYSSQYTTRNINEDKNVTRRSPGRL